MVHDKIQALQVNVDKNKKSHEILRSKILHAFKWEQAQVLQLKLSSKTNQEHLHALCSSSIKGVKVFVFVSQTADA